MHTDTATNYVSYPRRQTLIPQGAAAGIRSSDLQYCWEKSVCQVEEAAVKETAVTSEEQHVFGNINVPSALSREV